LTRKRVLIVYYSYTQQTKTLIKKFSTGLEEAGIAVQLERIVPASPYELPFRTNLRLAIAMVQTFFQKRMTIMPVSKECCDTWDCIILAGPTWSYFPSGPMLDFMDRYSFEVCAEKLVVPFISCRSYWRLHYWTLKKRLRGCGARVEDPIVFMHPIKEPWRIIGLILKLRGKGYLRKTAWFRKHYPGYGHSREQGEEALQRGRHLGEKLLNGSYG